MKYIDKKCECCGEMMRKEPKAKNNFGDVTQCKTCRFRGHLPSSPVICCDYTDITGKARLCDPSPNCTKYEKGKARVVQPSTITIRGWRYGR